MIIIILLLSLFISTNVFAARVHRTPENCIPNDPTATDGLDNDGNGVVDQAQTALAFSAVTGGYAAQFESGCYSTRDYESVADATTPASGNAYLRLKSGKRFAESSVAMCGNFTTGDYYVRIYGYADDRKGIGWIDTSPIPQHPLNTKASALLLGTDTGIYRWNASEIGLDLDFSDGQHGTMPATFSLSGNACLYIAAQTGMALDAIFLTTVQGTTPALPGGDPTPDYTILKRPASETITIDGQCDEGIWAGANQVQWTGFSDSSNVVSMRMLWDTGTGPVYVCATVQDTDLRSSVTTEDFTYTAYADDLIGFLFKDDQAETADAETWKVMVALGSTAAQIWDGNYPSGTETASNDLTNRDQSRTITGTMNDASADTQYEIEFKFDLPYSISNNSFYRCDHAIQDRDTAGSTYKIGKGQNLSDANNPANWGLCKWSSTEATVPGAAPVLGTPESPPPVLGPTNATVRATVNQDSTCWVDYDTDGSGAPYANTNIGTVSSSGGFCTVTLTGLSASTQHWYVIKAQNASGTGTSAEGTFTTTAAPGGTGSFFYTSTESYWTTKLATSCESNPNSQQCKDDLLTVFNDPHPDSAGLITYYVDRHWNYVHNRKNWSVSVWEAQPSDTLYTVQGHLQENPTLYYPGSCAMLGGESSWDQIRIPDAAVPPQYDYPAPQGSIDGHMIIYDANSVWELNRVEKWCGAARCTGASPAGPYTWKARTCRKWPRSGSPVDTPYIAPFKGGTTACSGSATQSVGTVLKSELEAGVINHAIRVTFSSEYFPNHWSFYPCTAYRGGNTGMLDTRAHKTGERLMLDPTINIDSFTTIPLYTRIILKAYQQYGAIITDSVQPSEPTMSVAVESDTGKAWNWDTLCPNEPGGKCFGGVNVKDLIGAMKRVKCSNVPGYSSICPSGE